MALALIKKLFKRRAKLPEGALVSHPTTGQCTHFEILSDRELRFCHGIVWVIYFPREDQEDRYATWCTSCGEVRDFLDNEPDYCLGCGEDMRGDWILQRNWHLFGARRCSERTIIIDQRTDRTVAYEHGKCGHKWRASNAR